MDQLAPAIRKRQGADYKQGWTCHFPNLRWFKTGRKKQYNSWWQDCDLGYLERLECWMDTKNIKFDKDESQVMCWVSKKREKMQSSG